MSIDSRSDSGNAAHSPKMLVVDATGFPPSLHPAEPDLFCRQTAMPAHDQGALERAHIVVVGCGGLGSWIALGLARMGVRQLTLFDGDSFDRTNAPRQLVFPADLQEPKAAAVARNLAPHMTNPGRIVGIARPFDASSVVTLKTPVDLMVVGVDNNRARLEASRLGVEQGIPVVFAMLSRDGMRAQVFLQRPGGPCLFCVLPNLDLEAIAPCAAASVASCYLAAAHAIELGLEALSFRAAIPFWREASLDGSADRSLRPPGRDDCRASHR